MTKEMTITKIAIFRKKEIRKTIHKNEWWFVVNDVVTALTDTLNVKDYVRKMRSCDVEPSKGWGQIVTPLSIATHGGIQKLNCANTEGMFRIRKELEHKSGKKVSTRENYLISPGINKQIRNK